MFSMENKSPEDMKPKYSLSYFQIFQIIVFIILFITVIAQGFWIQNLQGQIDSMRTTDDSTSYESRITMLEYIINAHTADLHDLNKDVWDLKTQENNLNFRLLQMEWDLKSIQK